MLGGRRGRVRVVGEPGRWLTAPGWGPPREAPPVSLTAVFPKVGFSAETPFTLLPLTFTGTVMGAETVFPESTPGEPTAAASASAANA